MAFKGEVATGNKVYLGIWKIALEGLGTFWDERRVVLSPDSQQWGLVGTEIFLELRIELKVNVVQQSDHSPEIHFVGKAQLHGIPAHFLSGAENEQKQAVAMKNGQLRPLNV